MAASTTTRIARALGSGLAGAGTLTALHETARRTIPHAPRLDVIGMRATRRILQRLGRKPPRGRKLFRETLVGDLIANAVFYSLVGGSRSSRAWLRGAMLGAAAGLGGALLPPVLGLGRSPGGRRPVTPLMTFGLYLAGGLTAAAVSHWLSRGEERREPWPADPYATA